MKNLALTVQRLLQKSATVGELQEAIIATLKECTNKKFICVDSCISTDTDEQYLSLTLWKIREIDMVLLKAFREALYIRGGLDHHAVSVQVRKLDVDGGVFVGLVVDSELCGSCQRVTLDFSGLFIEDTK